LGRKRKSGDCPIGSDTRDQHIDNVDPPSPSQCTQPRKRGRLSRQPEARIIDVSEDDEGRINGEEEDKRRLWTEAELKQFVYALMGPDGYWERFAKNPNNVFKKVSVVAGDVVSTRANFTLRLRKSTSLTVLMPRH
jgi:hypothetical protein